MEDFFNQGYTVLITKNLAGMHLTTYLKNAVNATACTLCICRKAFNEWSPVPLGTITAAVALLWSMDILVKKWVRMAKASKGSIFTAKPEPGKKLPLNWKYIDTLDNSTKLNFHRLIAVTGDRLRVAGYYKMKEYPVLLLFLFKKFTFKTFSTVQKETNLLQICKFFRLRKRVNPLATVAFVTNLGLI